MNIPRLKSIDTALYVYYSFPEMGTSEIELLFNKVSKSNISRLKNVAKELMYKENICSHGLHKVNTETAFKAWGIDVLDLERRREKLKSLNLEREKTYAYK